MRHDRDLHLRLRSAGFGAPPAKSGLGAIAPAELAATSPVLAYARAIGAPFAPYLLNIQATFSDPNVLTLNPSSFSTPSGRGVPGAITQPSIVDAMMFEVDCASAYSGSVFKSESDFYFGLQSGIQATLETTGAPRYTVAPYFTPLRTLCAMVDEGWPGGWVLGHTQSIVMQFQASIPLPFLPTTVTVTFRLWTPYSDDFIQMTDPEARGLLAQLASTAPQVAQAGGPSQTMSPPANGTPGPAAAWSAPR
jgi:hypothetical protein